MSNTPKKWSLSLKKSAAQLLKVKVYQDTKISYAESVILRDTTFSDSGIATNLTSKKKNTVSIQDASKEQRKLKDLEKAKPVSIWTPKLKKLATQQLLNVANSYEVKKRTSLRNIDFKKTGQAQWRGNAHDYSVWIDSLKPQ